MLEVASAPSQRCMSSLTKSARVRPKSPPLQAPSVTPARSSARAGDMHRIELRVSGMSNCLLLAPAATSPRSRPLFRTAAAAGFIGLAVDPDHGKYQDGAHAIARSGIYRRARPARRRKINDSPHVSSL